MNISCSSRISQTTPYAFAEIEKQVVALKEQGVQVIDFGVGDPTAPTPDFIVDALKSAGSKHAASGYPSYVGSLSFREAVSEYMQNVFGVSLNPETEIVSSIGSKEAVFHFPLGIIDSGDIVICPTPGYPPYKIGTHFAGGIPYFVPLLAENNFLIDFQSIPEEICNRAKIIWINYPNSPTGALAPRVWLEELISWAHRHNIIIAADEGCYIELYFDERPISILEIDREGIIVFYSLSKRNNMTGYRVGFCAGDERIVDVFKKVKTNADSGTPNFMQEAAVVALRDTTHIASLRREYRQKKEILLPALQDFGLPLCNSASTFYLWQKAPEGESGVDLAQRFLELGIVVTPGAYISDSTESGCNPGEEYVRIALVPTIEEVEEAAERLRR